MRGQPLRGKAALRAQGQKGQMIRHLLAGSLGLILIFPFSRSAEANHVHMQGGPFLGVVLSVVVDPRDPQVLYAAAYGGGVFRSRDRGASWTVINQGLPNRQVFSLLMDSADSNQLYLGTDQGIFHSSDKGTSWKPLVPLLKDRNVRALVSGPANSGLLYAATDQGVFQGRGDIWQQTSHGLTSKDVRALAVSPTGRVYAGTFGGVFKKEQKESSWTPINKGLKDKQVRALAIDSGSPDTFYAGTASGGVFKTTDGGKRWKGMNRGLLSSGVLSLVVTSDWPQELYAGTVSGVFKSANGGENWLPVGEELGFTVPVLTFDPSELRLLYAGSGGRIFKSSNAGETWEEIAHEVNYFSPTALSKKR